MTKVGMGILMSSVLLIAACDDGTTTVADDQEVAGDADADSDTDADSDADADNDSDADADTDSDADNDSDADADSDADTDADSDSDTEPELDCDSHPWDRPADGTAANGEYCYKNVQCASGLCIGYRQTTPDPEGKCEAPSNPLKMVAVGTTIDFETREPVPGARIETAGAATGAMLGCNTPAAAIIISDEDGRFYKIVDKPIDIVGYGATIREGNGYANSACGVADPPYPPGFIRHDLLMVKKATLEKWSEMLEEDPDMKNHVPLVVNGGVVGSVPCVDSGNPVIGAKLRSLNGNSGAKIRYLNADGTGFVTDGITESGIFVLVNPGLAEKFDVYLNDSKINITTGKAGDTKCMIFVLDIPIECDEFGIETCE